MNGLLERSMAKFIIYPVIRQLCRFHRVLRCPSRKPSPRGKSDQWIYSFSFYRIVHRKRMIGFSGSMCPVHFRFDSLSTRIDFFFEFPFLQCVVMLFFFFFAPFFWNIHPENSPNKFQLRLFFIFLCNVYFLFSKFFSDFYSSIDIKKQSFEISFEKKIDR